MQQQSYCCFPEQSAQPRSQMIKWLGFAEEECSGEGNQDKA
jgi:hypothetical protein